MEGCRDAGMEGWRDAGMQGCRNGGMQGWRSSFLSSAHFRTCFTDIRLPFPSHFRDVFSLPFCLFAVYLPREAEHESRSASTVGGSSGAGPSERRARIRLVCLSVCLSVCLTD